MTKTIGVITNDATNIFQRQVIAGIHAIAHQRGYAVQIENRIDTHGERLALNRVAGILVIANVLGDDELRQLYASGKPLSLVSHRVRYTPIPAVIPDNTGGISALVDYLVARGKRRIAFIQGDLNQNDGVERTNAFRRQLMRHNIPIDERLFLRGDFERGVARQSMRDFLRADIAFDAVAGADYLLAITAQEVLREANRDAGMCVVGFGDGMEAAEAQLTTVGVDVEQLGIRATRQLIGQCEGLKMGGITILSTSIVERESC
ncbi:MAG: substrate-binding domain-containing protein [Anaerolineae bacterium]|jgi:LacI family transcriptional regulator|nr:substrate-binding domain-containing protein [Anaerolineae bacterium]